MEMISIKIFCYSQTVKSIFTLFVHDVGLFIVLHWCHRPLVERPAVEEENTYLSVFSTVVTLVLVLSTRPE